MLEQLRLTILNQPTSNKTEIIDEALDAPSGNSPMRKAVIFDKDGVINHSVQRDDKQTSPWTFQEFLDHQIGRAHV